MSLKIVFMGTPEFSIPALEKLIENKFSILTIYTQPPKKSERGQKINASPIEKFSIKNKINFRNPKKLDNDEEFKIFKGLSPDLVIVVAYGKIIPKSFLNVAKFGFINIHASILPKWRGAAPIQRAIMNGDKKVGVSIMKINEKLDTGPVLSSEEIKLNQQETCDEIEKKLSKIGANLLIEGLKDIESGKAKFVDQIHTEATYAKKINKKETKINWNLDANKVLAHIHGLSSSPGAWFEYENERYKILRANKSESNGKAGCVIDKNLTIACKSSSIKILELQRQGKKRQTAEEFLHGNEIKDGSFLN